MYSFLIVYTDMFSDLSCLLIDTVKTFSVYKGLGFQQNNPAGCVGNPDWFLQTILGLQMCCGVVFCENWQLKYNSNLVQQKSSCHT